MNDKTVGYCLGRMITALQAPLINSEVVSEALSDLVGLINASETREAKLREALEACSTAIDAHFGYIPRQGVSMRLAGVMARAALREEGEG